MIVLASRERREGDKYVFIHEKNKDLCVVDKDLLIGLSMLLIDLFY